MCVILNALRKMGGCVPVVTTRVTETCGGEVVTCKPREDVRLADWVKDQTERKVCAVHLNALMTIVVQPVWRLDCHPHVPFCPEEEMSMCVKCRCESVMAESHHVVTRWGSDSGVV